MNRQKSTVEKFARFVELIKKIIISDIKRINKLRKDLDKANGPSDKQALLDKIKQTRDDLERYRMVLDDLAYACVKENKAMSQKIWKHFKYKTAEGFLMDRESPDKPSLEQMVEIITEHMTSIPMIYQFEYNEMGQRIVRRNLRGIKADPFGPMIFDTMGERKTVIGAASSGIRHK